MIRNKLILGVLLSAGLLFTASSIAANSIVVNFKGNLILNPPCEITGIDNGPISVDFSDMVIRKITGTAYKQQVRYKLTCDASDTTKVALTFKGDGASFNSSALRTLENPDLGIGFLDTNYPIRLNIDPIIFDNNKPTTIYAYPIINKGVDISKIKSGAFTAGATLEASYP